MATVKKDNISYVNTQKNKLIEAKECLPFDLKKVELHKGYDSHFLDFLTQTI